MIKKNLSHKVKTDPMHMRNLKSCCFDKGLISLFLISWKSRHLIHQFPGFQILDLAYGILF